MKIRIGILIICCMLLTVAGAHAAGPPAKPYQQEYFVLGFWGDPAVDDLVNERYAEVKAAHFNVVLGGMGADTPEKAKKQRDACEKLGMKVIFATYGLPIDKLCNCTTTYGFLVRDHPSVADFPGIRTRIDDVRGQRPGKLPFVNLFPDTASAADMGADTYEAYVSGFVEAVHPEVLCVDNYPSFLPTGADGRGSFCGNLAAIRSAAASSNVPFWCFIKAMACGSDAVPTESQIRWQAYAALAHGAKGILYSCYATPPTGNSSDFRGTGMIAPDGRQTERYAQVTQLNAALKNLGQTLMPLAGAGVEHVAEGQTLPANFPITVAAKAPGDEFIVGLFNNEKGGLAVLIMNYADQGANATPTISLAAPSARIAEVSKTSGKTESVNDENASMDGLQLSFAPGDGRLFIIEQ